MDDFIIQPQCEERGLRELINPLSGLSDEQLTELPIAVADLFTNANSEPKQFSIEDYLFRDEE